MDTFPPPAPIVAPPPLQMQPQSTPIPTMNTNFTIPSMVNTIPMDVDPVAQNNISHSAANPTPSPAAGLTPNPHHPPYADMIASAIEALKEKDGSSKRAIAKYIEQSYGGLPSTHSSLLSHHLKRLKNSGHLVMVKKSYKLPKPGSAVVVTESQTLPTSGTPRGRGRPPKPKPDSFAQPIAQPGLEGHPFPQPPAQFIGQTLPAVQLNGQAAAQPNIQANPQPVLVALGLVDEPNSAASGKKRPGRPRKIMAVGGGGVPQGAPGFAKRGRGRPPGKLVGTRLSKKSPGRPRKPKSVLGPSGPKRGPGRPSKAEPKTMIIPYATNVPDAGAVDQNSVPSVISMTPKPRGRPKKVAGSVGAAAGVGILSGKRRGRPPKVAGVNIFKKSTARSVGRPRKNSQPSTAASDALIAANGELKRKLDYFQSKVKQAVGMLKPELTHESSVTAIAAVQELEEVATMDLSAPLVEEVQHPAAQTQ